MTTNKGFLAHDGFVPRSYERRWRPSDMEMDVAVIENVTHVKLRGRLDTHGVDQIETKFTASIVPSGRNALIDLSELAFISSMGSGCSSPSTKRSDGTSGR